MKSIYTLLFLAASAASISAQQTSQTPANAAPTGAKAEQTATKVVEPMAVCDLTIAYSPIINSLKLGMPEAEAALKLGTQFEKDSADSKRKRVTLSLEKNTIFNADKITSGTVTSANDKVTSFRYTYNQPWTTAKEFVNTFAPKLGLVRIAFRLDEEKREAKIACKDFTLELRAFGAGSELFITETSAAAGKQ